MPPIASASTEDIKNVFNDVCDLGHQIYKDEDHKDKDKLVLGKDIGTDFNHKREIVWLNVFLIGLLHIFGLRGAYLTATARLSLSTVIFGEC